jgi:hypothetical protein
MDFVDTFPALIARFKADRQDCYLRRETYLGHVAEMAEAHFHPTK